MKTFFSIIFGCLILVASCGGGEPATCDSAYTHFYGQGCAVEGNFGDIDLHWMIMNCENAEAVAEGWGEACQDIQQEIIDCVSTVSSSDCDSCEDLYHSFHINCEN